MRRIPLGMHTLALSIARVAAALLALTGLYAGAPLAVAQQPSNQTMGRDFQPDLAAALQEIMTSDQEIRGRVAKMGQRALPTPKVFADEWQRVDDANLAKLRELIKEYGWPGKSKAGDRGAMAAFLVIQHADLKTQEEFLPLIRESVEKGENRGSELALLEDRVRIRNGQKQLYGSQMTIDESGKYVPMAIEDEEHVDARRASMGMPKLSAYVKLFNKPDPRSKGNDNAAAPAPLDQALRKEVMDLTKQYTDTAPDIYDAGMTRDESTWPAEVRSRRQAARDAIAPRLMEIIETRGFPGPWLIGEDAGYGVMAFLDDAPLEYQRKALARLQSDIDSGKPGGLQLAWLTDRVRVAEGKPQLYGTQMVRNASTPPKFAAAPVEDREHIDQRREKVGLIPLDEYVAILNGSSSGSAKAPD